MRRSRDAQARSAGGVLPALVTDVHSRAAVACLRALGRAGVRASALADRPTAAGLWSRHATSRHLGPPSRAPEAWAARIGALASERGPLVVLPAQEEAVGALLATAGTLPGEVVLPYPGAAAVQALRDKGSLARLAAEAGLPSPRVLAEGPAGDILAEPPDGPVVVKARDFSDALPAVRVCDRAGELLAVLGALPDDEPVIVQERLPGRLVAVGLVLDRDGAVVERVQQEARRLWPAAAGASSVAVSVPPDDALVGRCARLLRAAGFWGLAQVQLLSTAGGHRAIDVNPRPYGSLPLATTAGANLPAAWHAVAQGRPWPGPTPYRVGVGYEWLEGELTAALNGEPARLRTRPPRPRAGAMWAPDDPVPGVLLGMEWGAAVLRRRVLGRD